MVTVVVAALSRQAFHCRAVKLFIEHLFEGLTLLPAGVTGRHVNTELLHLGDEVLLIVAFRTLEVMFAGVVGLLDDTLPVQPIAATWCPEGVRHRLVRDLIAADQADLVGSVTKLVRLLTEAVGGAEGRVGLAGIVEAVEGIVNDSAVQVELDIACGHRTANHRSVSATVATLERSAALHFFKHVLREESLEALVDGAVLFDGRTEEYAVVVSTDPISGHEFAQPILIPKTGAAQYTYRLWSRNGGQQRSDGSANNLLVFVICSLVVRPFLLLAVDIFGSVYAEDCRVDG